MNVFDYAADVNIYDQEWVEVTLTTQHGRFDLAIYMLHVWLRVDLVGTLIWSASIFGIFGRRNYLLQISHPPLHVPTVPAVLHDQVVSFYPPNCGERERESGSIDGFLFRSGTRMGLSYAHLRYHSINVGIAIINHPPFITKNVLYKP